MEQVKVDRRWQEQAGRPGSTPGVLTFLILIRSV
jgi:hypothetical protein